MRLIKVILTDIAGVGLIILAALTGWIPGPGGIPLFLAGLGLLAIHHEWARRLLHQVKAHGLKFAEAFFREHKVLMFVYDVIALLLVGGSILVLINIHGVIRASAGILFFLGLALFLGNRKRLQRINRYFRRQP
jgi:hypothetical protein